MMCERCLTKKAEPPPTRDVNRDSGTDSANGGWLRRLVRPLVVHISHFFLEMTTATTMPTAKTVHPMMKSVPKVLSVVATEVSKVTMSARAKDAEAKISAAISDRLA
jgi:hypothetical protein